jgi:hypothetical protein
MDEAKLREKLSKIEALFAGAATEGERVAAPPPIGAVVADRVHPEDTGKVILEAD